MQKYKIFLLVLLPGFITLIYLSCNEADVSRKPLTYQIINSRIANTANYLKQKNPKLIPTSDLIIDCQIRILRAGYHTNDTASYIFYGVSILDFNPTIGSKIFNEEIIISNEFATEKRNLNCFSRIVICKSTSGNSKYKFKISF